MKANIHNFIDFKRIDALLEGFNKSTGFVTAILDLEGNVLSQSGWRQMCTDFHRMHPETALRCRTSDTELANRMARGEKYHFYECLNGLVDVAVPIVINGEHIANLFTGQFFFEQPNLAFFRKQAERYGFDEKVYLDALSHVPVVSKEKVLDVVDFLLNMTQLISELGIQKQEQMEMADTLRKSESRFRTIFENSLAVMLLIDPETRQIVDANYAAEKFYGWSREQLSQMKVDQINTLSADKLAFEMATARNQKRNYFKFRHRLANGSVRDVEIYSSKIEIDGKDYLHSIIHDITDQVQAAHAIAKNEQILRLFVEHSPASIAMFDNNMCYLVASRRYLADYNLGDRDLTGRSHYDVFPEIPDRWKVIHQQCLAGETIREDEDMFPRADGKIDWVRWEIRPWHDTENRIGGIILFSEVITRQVESREALKESEKQIRVALDETTRTKEQLSQILDRISDGFASLDRNWTYTFVNERLARNTGKRQDELLGHNIWEVFPEAIGTPIHQAYLRAMKEQVAFDLKHYYPHLGRWFQHRFYPSPDGLSVFSKDIDDQKRAEEKIKEQSSLVRIAAEKAKLGGWNVILGENRSYWSDGVAAIHEMPPGYSPLVEDGINFYAPEWRDKITQVFTECATNGTPYDEEMEIITSTGKRVWIRTIGEAVRDENGKIYKVQGAFQDISEKKLAEEKSREKDLQFRKLSANVPDLIFQFTRKPDGSYCVPIASEGIRNIFGCTPEDVVDDFAPIARVIHPDDAVRVIEDIENSAKNLTYFTCEFRVQIPGRPDQWIFSRSSPERLPDGSVTWYGFNANITERREMENALRESEEKFRKIYEEGPYGMALVGADFKFLMANRTFSDITGYPEAELRHLTFRDITYPDDKDLGLENVRKLMRGEIPVYKLEKRYIRKDGSVIWVALSLSAIFDKEGKFQYNLSIVKDITQRKQDEEQIQTLNERLQLLVKAIQGLSVSTSMENIMEIVRVYARKLVNADGATFILREGNLCYYADENAVSTLWKGQRFPMTECISGWAMLNRQSVVIEDIYADSRIPVEPYKKTFVKSLAIAPIRLHDPLGAIGAYWGSNYSPTEIEIQLLNTLADAAAKAVENIQLIEGLETKIEKRTEQLRSANKELEAFTYSVSHDLRAPLRAINSFAEILIEGNLESLNQEGKTACLIIRDNAIKMNKLINDLLKLSRLSKKELLFTDIDMNVLVDLVYEEVTTAEQKQTISFHRDDLKNCKGDSNLIRQVLVNLISNAVKYSGKKEKPVIEITNHVTDTEVTYTIKDNGAGFDMKYVDRLFNVFQRLHTDKEFEGIGVGLAIVNRIINKHEGKVGAKGAVGKGAEFWFSLPRVK